MGPNNDMVEHSRDQVNMCIYQHTLHISQQTQLMTLVLSAMSGAAMSYAYEIQDHIIQYGVNISMAV